MQFEPYNLQRQIVEVLTNEDFTILLTVSEINFIKHNIVNNKEILQKIIAIIESAKLFVNFKINVYGIPFIVIEIANLYNKSFSFESVHFLSNIVRFTIDCLLTYKEHTILVSEIDKIDCMLDSCIKMLSFELRDSLNKKSSLIGFLGFNFCY